MEVLSTSSTSFTSACVSVEPAFSWERGREFVRRQRETARPCCGWIVLSQVRRTEPSGMERVVGGECRRSFHPDRSGFVDTACVVRRRDVRHGPDGGAGADRLTHDGGDWLRRSVPLFRLLVSFRVSSIEYVRRAPAGIPLAVVRRQYSAASWALCGCPAGRSIVHRWGEGVGVYPGGRRLLVWGGLMDWARLAVGVVSAAA